MLDNIKITFSKFCNAFSCCKNTNTREPASQMQSSETDLTVTTIYRSVHRKTTPPLSPRAGALAPEPEQKA